LVKFQFSFIILISIKAKYIWHYLWRVLCTYVRKLTSFIFYFPTKINLHEYLRHYNKPATISNLFRFSKVSRNSFSTILSDSSPPFQTLVPNGYEEYCSSIKVASVNLTSYVFLALRFKKYAFLPSLSYAKILWWLTENKDNILTKILPILHSSFRAL
jgi:hypothetical protein